MLVTATFVMLNNPKTGSSFCRAVLKEIHARRRQDRPLVKRISSGRGDSTLVELLLPNTKIVGNSERDQHGTWSQIPERYRDREVVSVVRNPYDRFLSMYEFRWWEKRPPVPRPVIEEHLPQFPDLSLDDFVQLNKLAVRYGRSTTSGADSVLGNQSAQFVQMFFRDPQRVLENASHGYIESGDAVADLAPVTFLRKEDLNHELALFLARHGYTEAEVDHAMTRQPVNVTRSYGRDRPSLWTTTALEYVRTEERLMLRTLAALGIEYDAPDGR